MSALYLKEAIARPGAKNLTRLSLANNVNLTSQAGIFIGDALKENVDHPIEKVSFKGVDLGDEGLVRILEAEIVKDVVIENRTPGKVIFIENSQPIVVCGQGLLKIQKLMDDKENKSLIPLSKFRSRFG